MLAKIRDNTNHAIVKILLSLLVFSFIGWGIGDFLKASNTAVAEVGGEVISVYDFSTAYKNNVQLMNTRAGRELTPQILAYYQVGNQTLNTLIQQALIKNSAKDSSLLVSNEQLYNIISSGKNFQDAEGKFDKTLYKRIVSQIGMSVDKYEKTLKEDILRGTILSTFNTNMYNDKGTIERLAAYNNETIDIETVEISEDNVNNVPSVSAKEIEEYYNANQKIFLTDEVRDINVLTISLEDIKNSITVDEEEAITFYNNNQSSYKTEEERQIKHILVDTEELANEIKGKVNADNFAELAAKYSIDTETAKSGGDKGYIKRGETIESFENAVFALNSGEISAPVNTPFGWHLIMLSNIKPEAVKEFSLVKEDIVNTLKLQKSEDKFYHLQEKLEDLIAGGEELYNIANELNVKHEQIKNVTTASTNVAAEILNTAFDLDLESVSDAIEENNGNKISYISVQNIVPSKQMTLAEATNNIKETLHKQKLAETLKEQSAKVIEYAKENSLEIAASKAGLKSKVTSIKNVTRFGTNELNWLHPSQLLALFDVKKDDVYAQPLLKNKSYVIAKITNKEEGKLSDEELAFAKEQLTKAINAELVNQFIAELAKEETIKVHPVAAKTVLGEEPLANFWSGE